MQLPCKRFAPLVLGLALAVSAGGCDMLSKARGIIGAAQEVEEHLEADLGAELTGAKIDKVLTVTPLLVEFSKAAKVKWKPDPNAADVTQLATALGGLSDYMAFFESHDTRITEYYVDIIKIYDARAQIAWKRAHAEAKSKLDQERKQLEDKRAAASGDEQSKLDKELERNKLALENLDKTRLQQEKSLAERRKQQEKSPYKLSDEEIARVEARYDEIDEVFRGADYVKGDDAKPSG